MTNTGLPILVTSAASPTPLTTWSMIPALRFFVMTWCNWTPGVSGTSKPFSVWIDGIVAVEDVHAAASSGVALDVVGHLVAGRARRRRRGPVGLGRRVVGQLVLDKNITTVLAVPDQVVLLEVLDEESGGGDLVAVDYDAVAADVRAPALGVPRRSPRCRDRRATPRCGRSSTSSRLISSATSVFPMCGPPTRK